MCNIEKLRNISNNNPNDTELGLIQNSVNNIKNIHKFHVFPLDDKLACIDMVKEYNSISFVSNQMGYNHTLIGKWVENEEKLRKVKLLINGNI